MPTITSKDVSKLCDVTAAAQDEAIAYRKALQAIATMWPEPDSCGDLSVYGVNDGKARLITAHSAINDARKVLGMPLHKFPGEKAAACELCFRPFTPGTPCLGDLVHDVVD
jgi:hypothetical protein